MAESLKEILFQLIKEREDAFEFIRSYAHNGIWFADKSDTITEQWINPRFWKTLEYDQDLINVDKPEWGEILHPDDWEKASIMYFDFINERRDDYDVKIRFKTKTGKWIWMNCRGMLITSIPNECDKVLVALTDITKQHEKELSLNKLIQRYNHIIEGTHIGTWEWNVATGETIFNERWAEMIGYTLEELKPTDINTWAKFAHPDDLEQSNALLQEHFEGKSEFYEFEARIQHKNGHWIWVHDKGKLITRTPDGSPEWMTGSHQDITFRKKNEEEIKSLLVVATNQNTRLLNFAHIASHNLRSHVGNLVMLEQLLQNEFPEVSKNQYATLMSKAIENLSETVDHLNEVVKYSSDQADKLAPLEVKQYIIKAIDDISALIEEVHGEVIINIPNELEVMAIPAYLESIILNLMTNAIKYRHPERAPLIKLTFSKNESMTCIHFQDNGLGIDMKKYGEKLFGMYNTFHDNKDSKGIGLYITRNQVEAMGGTIEVSSKVNEGTLFTVSFKKPDELSLSEF